MSAQKAAAIGPVAKMLFARAAAAGMKIAFEQTHAFCHLARMLGSRV